MVRLLRIIIEFLIYYIFINKKEKIILTLKNLKK